MTDDSLENYDASGNIADPELERLLTDAYDAPPVPRSLLKRIERAVQDQWELAPELADEPGLEVKRSPARRAAWTKVLSVVATIAAAVLLMVVVVANSGGYAWATMLDALARQGVVQVSDLHGTRWLSLSEGFIGEETAETSRLLDVQRGVMLMRDHGQAQIERRNVEANLSVRDRDRLLVSFLLADSLQDIDPQRLAGLRVVEESWQWTAEAGRNEVSLRVRFKTDATEHFSLNLTLDPDSHLPTACEVHGTDIEPTAERVALSYPAVKGAELREREFPAQLPVVDVSPSDGSFTTTDDAGGTALATADSSATEINDQTAQADRSSALLLEAASQWQPVEVIDRSQSDVLQQVDALLAELWKENDVQPAAVAGDEELLRRVYLDLLGRTPTVSEARAYLSDRSSNRYEVLVDRLLQSPDHASHLATTWRTFLLPEGVDLTAFGGVEAFDQWLAESFACNDSYDEVVRSLLLAEGRLSRSGPLLFYSAVKLDPDQLAARTARVFLGMRLECAQCHDHPFEPWTQQDFWSLAAFFAQISRPQAELESVSTVMRVHDVTHGEVMLPETETIVPPKFLDGAQPAEDQQALARRQQLARWLTSPRNPYFPRATANRVWGHMFGKGIIDPMDDMGVQNPPKSPELLDLLASHFINTDFNLRELFRTVALSSAYRLSSAAPTVDEQRMEWFAQMHVKALTAEQVYDCITVATMLDTGRPADPYGFQIARFDNTDRDVFLQQFRTPAGSPTEYYGGIPQALTLMNGTLIEGATDIARGGLLQSLNAPFFTQEQRIEVLYLATLSRRPRPSEWELLKNYVPESASGTELQEGLADILWALLNSAEFTVNH